MNLLLIAILANFVLTSVLGYLILKGMESIERTLAEEEPMNTTEAIGFSIDSIRYDDFEIPDYPEESRDNEG